MKKRKPQYIGKDRNILRQTVIYFFLLLLAPTQFLLADVSNVRITISQDETIVMDLSNVIVNITNPSVSVSSSPATGNTATAVTCADQSQVCIQYDPSPTFIGTDTFNYSVTNDVGGTETATITVVVGSVSTNNHSLSPARVIDTVFETICAEDAVTLFDLFCADFYDDANPAPQDAKDEMLRAISPQNVGAQGTLANNMVKEQMGNVNQRLTALRVTKNIPASKKLAGNGIPVMNIAEGESNSVADIFNKKWDWFVSAKVGGGDQDETLYEDGFDFDSNTITSGADFRYNDALILGFALGYGSTDMTVNHNYGGMDLSGFSTTLYSSYNISDKIYLDGILNLTRNSFDMSRRIVFGIVDETAKADTDSMGIAFSVGGGYEILLRGALTITATARLDYINTTIEAYQEKDAGIYNLYVGEQDVSQLFSSIGAQAQYAMSQSWGVLLPQANITWLHQFDDDPNKVQGYFVADTNQTVFSFDTNSPEADFLQLSLGTSAVFPGGKSGYFQYETTLAQDNLRVWNVSAGVRLEF